MGLCILLQWHLGGLLLHMMLSFRQEHWHKSPQRHGRHQDAVLLVSRNPFFDIFVFAISQILLCVRSRLHHRLLFTLASLMKTYGLPMRRTLITCFVYDCWGPRECMHFNTKT